MPSDETGALLPGTRIAGYEIKRKLGQGGFGIAYEGWNEDLHHRAAIKEYFPSDAAYRTEATVTPISGPREQIYGRFLDRFIAEARLVNRLDHPNIVKIRHLERANGTAYVVMDFIDGQSLSGWLKEHHATIDADKFRAVFEPILDALAYVHDRDLLHRDISPANIMIDGRGRPMLIDFGAFKEGWVARPGVSSMIVANPAYAPPEQAMQRQGAQHGPPTDIYSLAAVMYYVLAWGAPANSTNRSLAVSVGDGDPLEPIDRIARFGCPPRVFTAINSALSLNARQRPQTIAAFREALGWASKAIPEDERTWLEIDRGDDETILLSFVQRFPSSPHVPEARERLEAIKRQSKTSGNGSEADRTPPGAGDAKDRARDRAEPLSFDDIEDHAQKATDEGRRLKRRWLRNVVFGAFLSIPVGFLVIAALAATAEELGLLTKPFPQSPYIFPLLAIPMAIAVALAWITRRIAASRPASTGREIWAAFLNGIASQQVFWVLAVLILGLLGLSSDTLAILAFTASGVFALATFAYLSVRCRTLKR